MTRARDKESEVDGAAAAPAAAVAGVGNYIGFSKTEAVERTTTILHQHDDIEVHLIQEVVNTAAGPRTFCLKCVIVGGSVICHRIDCPIKAPGT